MNVATRWAAAAALIVTAGLAVAWTIFAFAFDVARGTQ